MSLFENHVQAFSGVNNLNNISCTIGKVDKEFYRLIGVALFLYDFDYNSGLLTASTSFLAAALGFVFLSVSLSVRPSARHGWFELIWFESLLSVTSGQFFSIILAPLPSWTPLALCSSSN